MNSSASETVQLDFLGRVHQTLIETGRLIHATVLAQAVVSLLAILIVFGVVSTGEKYEVAGFRLDVQSPLLLFALAISAAALLAYLLALMQHESDLRDGLVDLYQCSGLSNPQLSEKLLNPLEYPHIMTTVESLSARDGLPRLMEGPVKKVTKGAVQILTIGLPLIAQILVIGRLRLSGATGFAVAAGVFALLPLIFLRILSKTASSPSFAPNRPGGAPEPPPAPATSEPAASASAPPPATK